jgi:hypothetical protein
VNVEPVSSVMKRIMDQYNKKTEGWRVFVDWKGNVLILSPEVGYRLKLVPLNPREYTGVGVKINGLDETQLITDGVPSYGFRPLSKGETTALLGTVHQGSIVQNRLIKKLLTIKPVPIRELQKKGLDTVLTGPVTAHPNLNSISKGQQELEKKLTMEAYKLFRKKYPHRAAMYR